AGAAARGLRVASADTASAGSRLGSGAGPVRGAFVLAMVVDPRARQRRYVPGKETLCPRGLESNQRRKLPEHSGQHVRKGLVSICPGQSRAVLLNELVTVR